MTTRRSLIVAFQALAAGFAALVLTPAANATLVYTIERTNSTFTTSFGGYQITSNSAGASTSVGFDYNNSITGAIATNGSMITLVSNNFGLTTSDAAKLQISSSGQSVQLISGLKSFVVDNETQATSGVSGPIYFKVTVSQDAFTRPMTDPLGFNISLTQQNADDALVQFQASLTTDSGTGSLGPITGGSATATAGSIPVVNSNLSSFTVLGTTYITLDVSGDGGLSNSITATGQANVTAAPEPATVLSMAIGLPLLGLGAWVRRRRQSS